MGKRRTTTVAPRIVGSGYCVPDKIRGNDADCFRWLKENVPDWEKLFNGYEERRVLSAGEHVMDIMLPAAQSALKNAKLKPKDVDLLLGMASVSEYTNPNELSQLHHLLKLPERCWALPIANVYSNYNACILLADSMLRSGRVKNVLIVVGGNWTRNVDYHTPQCISAADGAGACVMSMSKDKSKWTLVDSVTLMDTNYYGSMFTGRTDYTFIPPYNGNLNLYSDHFFTITKKGQQGFKVFGIDSAADSVKQVLRKNKVKAKDICLMPNQSSASLIDPWVAAIKPGQEFDTLTTFANMTVGTKPVNFAYAEENNIVTKDKLVMMSLGPDMHSNSLLMERG